MKLQTSVQIKTEAADGACKNQQHRVHWGTAGPVDEAGRRGQTGEFIVLRDKSRQIALYSASNAACALLSVLSAQGPRTALTTTPASGVSCSGVHLGKNLVQGRAYLDQERAARAPSSKSSPALGLPRALRWATCRRTASLAWDCASPWPGCSSKPRSNSSSNNRVQRIRRALAPPRQATGCRIPLRPKLCNRRVSKVSRTGPRTLVSHCIYVDRCKPT